MPKKKISDFGSEIVDFSSMNTAKIEDCIPKKEVPKEEPKSLKKKRDREKAC